MEGYPVKPKIKTDEDMMIKETVYHMVLRRINELTVWGPVLDWEEPVLNYYLIWGNSKRPLYPAWSDYLDWMITLGGDLAIVEQAENADDGQIVVAVVDNAITLKRIYRETNRIRLQPENPEFQPLYCTDVRIVGILTGLVRTY